MHDVINIKTINPELQLVCEVWEFEEILGGSCEYWKTFSTFDSKKKTLGISFEGDISENVGIPHSGNDSLQTT